MLLSTPALPQIRNTNRELDDQRKSAEELSQSFAGFGDILKANLASNTIMNAVGQLTNMLKTAAANVYATGSSFEAGMSRVEAISGASGDSSLTAARNLTRLFRQSVRKLTSQICGTGQEIMPNCSAMSRHLKMYQEYAADSILSHEISG